MKTITGYAHIADHVKCNMCQQEAFVRVGADICPHCHTEGCLADIRQEVQVPAGHEELYVDTDFNEEGTNGTAGRSCASGV